MATGIQGDDGALFHRTGQWLERPSRRLLVDIHVHAVPRGGRIPVRGWRRALFAALAARTGAGEAGPEGAAAYMSTLAVRLRRSRFVRAAVLLALDRPHDAAGTPCVSGGEFSVSNEDVLWWCGGARDCFLYGASVHPRRRDALDALDEAAERGAVLVKWLPNSQRIDPGDPGHRAYYRRLARLGLPLLCHSGREFILPAPEQSSGGLERLRLPLEEGVTVIAAHGGSNGLFCNRGSSRRFRQILIEYPNLYGDTAALGLPNRMGALLWWRGHPELAHRLFFATDYPVPFWTLPWRPFLNTDHATRLAREDNPFDRMALLLDGLGIRLAPGGFEALLHRLGRWPVAPASPEGSRDLV